MLLNSEIEQTLSTLRVNNAPVDFAFLHYAGDADEYIVYSQSDTMNSYAGDDEIIGVVPVYDFDIYSKLGASRNYGAIAKALRALLTKNNWTWQPNRDSADFYDEDTNFYHKTFCFAKHHQIITSEEV